MKKLVATAVMMTMMMVGIVVAERASLAPEAVSAAISDGTKAKGGRRGLVLRDSFHTVGRALSPNAGMSTGYSVEAWTPLSWIEQIASNHAKQFKQLKAADITDEMQEDVFRVVVHPDTATMVTARGAAGTSSVEHVVLRSEDKQVVIQPLSTEPFSEEAANAMGGKIAYEGVLAKFPMSALKEIRQGDGEFFITVVGATNDGKDFKVKAKHFKELK